MSFLAAKERLQLSVGMNGEFILLLVAYKDDKIVLTPS